MITKSFMPLAFNVKYSINTFFLPPSSKEDPKKFHLNPDFTILKNAITYFKNFKSN